MDSYFIIKFHKKIIHISYEKIVFIKLYLLVFINFMDKCCLINVQV